MTDEKSRQAILARRAKFLAAALAATLPACDREKEGIAPDHPTASVTDTGAPATSPSRADAALMAPCLEVAPLPADAAPADAGPKPMPCLKMLPPSRDAGPGPVPQPCLKVAPDD